MLGIKKLEKRLVTMDNNIAAVYLNLYLVNIIIAFVKGS